MTWKLLVTVGLLVSIVNSHLFAQSSHITIIELNNEKEYVLIKNTGDTAIHLEGWTRHDHDYGKANVYSYTCRDIVLQSGEV